MTDIAVSVRGLSKSYTIAHDQEKHITLAETMLARLKNPLRRPKTETFCALKDIDFDIKKGDVVGIIGRNGAGKSTLLKILSRITEPTTGKIDLYGRVGSLLEVGTGFHPELTGRENVFLNGAILGMSKAEIKKQFDAIVDFAGVEQFLDTPVKRYSSGMYVRLAFAVAAHLESEILIVDEVLAVGDAEFQRKCLGKMKDVARDGRSVVFVTHDIRSLRMFCEKGLYLRRGNIVHQSNIGSVVERYASDLEMSQIDLPVGDGPLTITFFDVGQMGRSELVVDGDQPFEVTVHFRLAVPTTLLRLGIYIKSAFGETISRSFHTDWRPDLESMDDGNYEARLRVPARLLMPGSYRFCLHASRYGVEVLVSENDVVRELLVTAPQSYNAAHPGEKWDAAVMLSEGWQVARL